MARIVVYSMGHRGDIYPYVPIAGELARRGHEVRFVLPREFHAQLAGEPFACVHSGTDFGPVALDAHGVFLARWGKRMGGVMTMRLYFGKFTVPHLATLFETLDSELATADLLISHPTYSLIGAMSCERRGLPWIVADPHSMFVPTAHAPPAGLPYLGERLTKAMWRVGRTWVLNPISNSAQFVAFRRRLGLDATDWNVGDAMLSPHLNLGLFSPLYVDVKPDWPSNYHLTGFVHWTGPEAGAIRDDVSAFLDGGDPPVIVTLGTSAASAFPEVFERAARALDALGVRGIHLTSSEAVADRVRAAVGSPSQAVWPFVPLRPLLGRARAIVHSGAYGTNALALEAGLASVIVPCLFDQLWHAKRQMQLGTGIHVRRPRDLVASLRRLLIDGELTAAATAFGASISGEDGTGRAADAVEGFLAGRTRVGFTA